MLIEPNSFHVVALLNKKIESGTSLNAIAHLSMGLAALVGETGREILQFLDFVDSSGDRHPSISARSLVVLRGSASDIIKLRNTVHDAKLPCVDFTSTMTGGDYQSQLLRTRETSPTDLEYWGIMTLGSSEVLRPMTRKYSLWR